MAADNTFPDILKRLMSRGYCSYPELLVALGREGCFAQYPPLQYMMQALPPSGLLPRLMCLESLGEAMHIACEFTNMTGFGREPSIYLMSSFAYAAGLLTTMPIAPPLQQYVQTADSAVVCEPGAVYAPHAWDARLTTEEKCRLLTSLVTVNRDNERRLGVKVDRVACVGIDKFGFKLTAELSRLDLDATGALFYAVYDRDSKIADIGAVGVLCYDSVSPLPRMVTVKVSPQDVSAIMIFWEDDDL